MRKTIAYKIKEHLLRCKTVSTAFMMGFISEEAYEKEMQQINEDIEKEKKHIIINKRKEVKNA